MQGTHTARAVVGLLTAALLCSALADDWETLAQMNVARGEHANAVVGGRIYVFAGIYNSTSGPSEVERYDPATDRWTVLGTMPDSRHHITAGSSVYGTEIWLCGGKPGRDNTGTTLVHVYNTATNRWRRGPDLPEVHWGGPAVVCGDSLHVLTGAQGSTVTSNHHFVLDLRNEPAGWSNAEPVPRPRVHGAGVALNGMIWHIGGEYHHLHDGDTRTVQVYDPATDSWDLSKAPLPKARSHHEWATFAHAGRIISVSGVNSAQNPRGQANIYEYDPSLDQWRELDPLPRRICSPGAKVVDGLLYVFGGGGDTWFPVTKTTVARAVGGAVPVALKVVQHTPESRTGSSLRLHQVNGRLLPLAQEAPRAALPGTVRAAGPVVSADGMGWILR